MSEHSSFQPGDDELAGGRGRVRTIERRFRPRHVAGDDVEVLHRP